MFGFSYGEIFLILGATAAVIGPKDLPVIARTAGRLAGRAIGYVQLARGHFDTVVQQSQARQVHKELQDTIAQLEAIRHEIRSVSLLSPSPLIRRMVDNIGPSNESTAPGAKHTDNTSKTLTGQVSTEQTHGSNVQTTATSKVSDLCNLHSQAAAYSRLAESSLLQSGSLRSGADAGEIIGDVGLLNVLPVSAESAGMLPNRLGDMKGSDVVLEAILEAEVAHNGQKFFAQPENQIKHE